MYRPSCGLVGGLLQVAGCCRVALASSSYCRYSLMLSTQILSGQDRVEVCVLTRVRDTDAVCEGTFLEGATLEG
jgi:hypothetical protein